MSVASILATAGNDVKGFFTKVASDFQKARAVWTALSSPQTRSVLVTLGTDAIKAVKDSEAAAAASGFSLQLDSAVVADIKQLIADAKAGEPVIAADLAILGIKL